MEMMNTNDGATSAALPAADYGTGVVIPLSEIDFEDDDTTLSDEAIWNRWSPGSLAAGVMGSPRVSSTEVPEEPTCLSCVTENAVSLLMLEYETWKTGEGPMLSSCLVADDALVDTATIDPLCRCEPGPVDCASDCPVGACRAQVATKRG